MTTEEMLSLPENGIQRWLIRGQLREMPMTVRNRVHSRIMVKVSYELERWLREQPEPRGEVLCGEAGCRLRRDPDTTVGIDVVYIPADVAAHEPDDSTLIDGVPVLVVEILSGNETTDQLHEKIDTYLEVGVALVWVIDPHYQTVTIYRPGQEPELVNRHGELLGEPHLPGFRVAVAQLFA
jgi:Uma2 family endonuclease